MANYRQIHTKIWKDGWFIDLCPNDKLLWIYLFSNERACLAGIYELPIAVIEFETGLGRDWIREALGRFTEAGKAFYEDGYVWIVNLIKYNAHSLTNPKIRGNIESSLDEIPDSELKRAWIEHYNTLVPNEQRLDTLFEPEDRVSIPYLHEQEQEQEQEHASKGASPHDSLPHNLDGWLDFIQAGKGQKGGMTARLGRMLVTLWPDRYDGRDPPYSKAGGIAQSVGGAKRLAHLLWQANAYKVTGDPLDYAKAMHSRNKSNGSGKSTQDRSLEAIEQWKAQRSG